MKIQHTADKGAWLAVAAVMLAMGAATLAERLHGPAFAARCVYHAWWFAALWGVVAVLGVVSLAAHAVWRRLPILVLHLSLLLILCGAMVTHLTGRTGMLHLRSGVVVRQFLADGDGAPVTLPFTLQLDRFEVVRYAGTGAPADYVSHLLLSDSDENAAKVATVSMNRVLQRDGFRLYQSSFDDDEQGSWLSVNYDPWGMGLTYVGYALLGLSMLAFALQRAGVRWPGLCSWRAVRMWCLILLAFGVLWTLAHFGTGGTAQPSWGQQLVARWLERMPLMGILAACCLSLGGWGFCNLLYCQWHGKAPETHICQLQNHALIAMLIVQALFFGLYGYAAGRVPLGNGFETMQALALCLLLLGAVLRRRFMAAVPSALLLAGFTLLTACLMQIPSSTRPLTPVLRSPLLSLHVSVIMMAYALLALTWCNALVALCLRRGTGVVRLAQLSRMLLCPAVFLLAAGIFLGAVWANVSWGSYWSWDPKETWALITLLAYSAPLHNACLPMMRRDRALHIYLSLVFVLLLMTYFGVNYLLGGLHSYANG